MSRPTAIAPLLLLVSVEAATLMGCAGPQPFVRDGDPNSVQIVYYGDVASAMPLARKHCGQFERRPRLVSRDTEVALFDCIASPRAP